MANTLLPSVKQRRHYLELCVLLKWRFTVHHAHCTLLFHQRTGRVLHKESNWKISQHWKYSFSPFIWPLMLSSRYSFVPLVKSPGTSRWLKSALGIVAASIYSTLFRTEQLRTAGALQMCLIQPQIGDNFFFFLSFQSFQQQDLGFKANISSY